MRFPPQELPEDIIQAEILMRLPVKSLVRSRCVCKLWKSIITLIISDHDIIKTCTPLDPDDEYLILNKVYEIDESIFYYDITLLSLLNASESSLYKDTFGRPDPTIDLQFLGSINGLVCLFSEVLNQFEVFNPALRQAKYIDPPFRPSMLDAGEYFYGFCWDVVKNDFKVVITYSYNRSVSDEGPHDSSYVYSCNSDSWSILLPHFSFNDRPVDRSTPSAIVNGMPYWTGCKNCGETSRYIFSVLKFEVGRNEFRMLPQFERAAFGLFDFFLVNLEECIYALVYDTRYLDSFVNVLCFDERYGVWNNMYNVGPINCHVDRISPFLMYDGNILFGARGKLMCHDRKANQNKDLGITGGYLRNCFSYKPSLVFLKGMKPTTSSRGFLGSNEGDDEVGGIARGVGKRSQPSTKYSNIKRHKQV